MNNEEAITRIRNLELENAARKATGRMAMTLTGFAGAALAALATYGVFKFVQFDEKLDVKVAHHVMEKFPEDSVQYMQFAKLIGDTKKLNTDFDSLFGKYKAALDNYGHIDKVKDDFDIEGKVQLIITEGTTRMVATRLPGRLRQLLSGNGGSRKNGDMDELAGTLFEKKWRDNALSTLEVFESLARKNINLNSGSIYRFDPDFIFNAGQAAARLENTNLAFRLISIAHNLRNSDAPIKAKFLHMKIAIGHENEVDVAFSQMMDMVRNLGANQPQIVLSEAWNSAEELRKYIKLADAITDLENNNDVSVSKPSYMYVIQSEAFLRASRPGDLERAEVAYEKAISALKKETVYSQWHSSTREKYKELKDLIDQSKQIWVSSGERAKVEESEGGRELLKKLLESSRQNE